MKSHLKELVRARMGKTGESYEQALRQVRAQEERAPASSAATEVAYSKSSARAASVADTAYSIAVVRAEEGQRPESDRLFEDPYASLFAATGAHAAEATQRFLELPFFRDGVRLRTRFLDDGVREALASGLSQLVLLGAGFDARALRLPEIAQRKVSVYEVDTEEQFQRKRGVLAQAGVQVPRSVSYVPSDLAAVDVQRDLTASLVAHGFRPGAGAVFVMEGVIGYIDDVAIDRCLRFMATAGGPGSRALFTFAASTFEPQTAQERTRRAGFSACDEIAGDALWRRYWPSEPHPNAWVTRVGTARV